MPASLFGTGLLFVALTVPVLAQEPKCQPLESRSKVSTLWSGRTVDLGTLREIVCRRDRPKTAEQILKTLEIRYDARVVDIDATDPATPAMKRARAYYKTIQEARKKKYLSRRATSRGIFSIATFLPPYSLLPDHPGSSERPFVEKPLFLIDVNVTRATIVHETVHFLLWKESGSAAENKEELVFDLTTYRSLLDSGVAPTIERISVDLDGVAAGAGGMEEFDVVPLILEHHAVLGVSEDDVGREHDYLDLKLRLFRTSLDGLTRIVAIFREKTSAGRSHARDLADLDRKIAGIGLRLDQAETEVRSLVKPGR